MSVDQVIQRSSLVGLLVSEAHANPPVVLAVPDDLPESVSPVEGQSTGIDGEHVKSEGLAPLAGGVDQGPDQLGTDASPFRSRTTEREQQAPGVTAVAEGRVTQRGAYATRSKGHSRATQSLTTR